MRPGNNLIIVAGIFFAGNAFAAAELGTSVNPALQKLMNAKVSCSNEQAYQPQPNGQGKDKSACQRCADSVKQWGERMKNDSQTAVGNDAASVAKGKSSMAQGQAAMTANQSSHQNTSSGVDKSGNQAQAERAANASNLGKQFGSCAKDVEQACQGNIDEQDKQKGKEAKQACEEGAKASEAVAADKAGSGMDMSQLGQMASQLAQGLGSMMQKKQGENSTPTPTDASAASVSTPETPAQANMEASKIGGALQQAQAANFDNVNGKTADVGTGAASVPGSSPKQVAASQSYDSGGNTGGGSGTAGSDPRGGGAGFAGGLGTSGGGAGSGGGNSSGASSYDPNAAAAKAAAGGQDANGAYEIAGGGSGSRFLGLKGKNGDLTDLDGALGTEAGGSGLDLASLGNGDEAGRDLASGGEGQAADIHADSSSLFNVIRSKLVEIKKRGNI